MAHESLAAFINCRAGRHFGKRVQRNQLVPLRSAKEHPRELQPLVNCGRGQPFADQEQFEVVGIAFGDGGHVSLRPEMVVQVAHDLLPHFAGRRLHVHPLRGVIGQKRPQR
ncbi:MAG TPA: hypothetical protein VG826_12770 [Pirellulales bacterium]|nr:hypothetical protein [Pirellulales bacterium]